VERGDSAAIMDSWEVSMHPLYKNKFDPIKQLNHILEFIDTPLIKFAYHQVNTLTINTLYLYLEQSLFTNISQLKSFYILFLTLFSYVMLCDFYPVNNGDPTTSLGLAISIPEIVLIIWVATFAVDLFVKVHFFVFVF
jgi:hypothetical protein